VESGQTPESDRSGYRFPLGEALTFSPSRNLLSSLLGVAVAAFLFGLAFPPLRLHGLAWVALAPLFWAYRGGGGLRIALLAWLWSALMAWSVGDWMPRAIVTYYQQPVWVGWAFFLGVATTMNFPYQLGFAFGYRALSRGCDSGALPRPALPLLAAALWCAMELLRGRLFTGTPFFIGNPWALLGYSQVGWDAVMQVASITGIYGVTFAVAAANAGWVEAARERRALVSGLAPALLTCAFGVVALSGLGHSDRDERRIAIVQGNLDIGSRWRSDLYGQNLGVYLRLTHSAIVDSEPEVVFWPEAAMTFFVEDEPLYRRSIGSVLSRRETELVAGGPRALGAPGPAQRYRNTIFRLHPDGEIDGHYDKEYLVPFAEYFPLRGVEMLRRRFENVRVFEPGGAPEVLDTRIGSAAVAICNEAMLPEVVSRRVAGGAAYILNPSNDTWIPEPRFAEQQLDIVTVRAIEQRRPLVRASTSGPSALVDRFGRVVARTDLGEATVLAGTLRPAEGRTVYAAVGDLFGALCVLVSAGALWRARVGSAPRAGGRPDSGPS
jgi:apolipoprotein N-acyltransferase